MKQRILHIVPTLARTGTLKQMSLLARQLPAEQFDVHVCALTRGGPLAKELAAAGIPVTVIGARWRLDPQACWRLRCEVQRRRPEVIHAWRPMARLYAHAVARACGVRRLVVEHREIDPHRGWMARAVDRHVARRSSQIVVNSPVVRDFCIRGGLPAEKIRVIANGVAPAGAVDTTRRQLLAELGLPEESRLVGFVGQLLPQKQIKDAIWAADLLKVIRKDVHLLIVGDGPMRDRLHTFRDQVVIRDCVHFLGDRGDVSRLMAHFDVFWSTSAYEGPSNALLEAMSAGVPVVATDLPTTREFITPGETGYLVPVDDRAAVARQTNQLLDDPDLARRVGAAGREYVRREYDVEKMVERYAVLYGGGIGTR